ncbi:metal ABC transporter permease [Pusillimonas sp. ANT_WB101]|uniref:metal ABC transporter permease n=1 Tax=Pusillimonas sp. ANT_WB101 TaxID=2597356 RepID=UPI0011EE8CA0|nr:metal ABC transporter permease [Pusillimonas sp. ANT_WB101]KAA0910818.1 metal ABC transporter permease [Pusillimonas sp. ANT_WB101]
MYAEFIQLSLTPLAVAVLASVVCAIPGNFLVLRKQSMLGDAISHVILLGLVGVFVLTDTLSTGPMLAGAAVAALLAVALIETIQRLTHIEPGAAIGVVFTTMFAAGVLWLEQSRSATVHFDVEHVLYGNLESLIWLDATGWHSLWDRAALATVPVALPRLIVILAVLIVMTSVGWRPLKAATFDQGFAASTGARPAVVSALLLAMVALATVAAFQAVGAIIVVAMLTCPAASARLLTNNLAAQVGISVLLAAIAALAGYTLAAWGPHWLGWHKSLSAAGMIASMGGLILALACLYGPCRHRPA